MARSTDGLIAGGKTAAYAFAYDDSLTPARGRDLVNMVLLQCDDDFNLIASWFPGVSLDMPIQVFVSNTSPGGFLGAEWYPAEKPRALTVFLGEFSSVGASPADVVRSFIVSEVSEMFMHDGGTDWKGTLNEGNMGESLSKFMKAEFVKQQGLEAFPVVNGIEMAVSQLWLNSARDNFIESSSDDAGRDASTGCGTLFVNFLHYQLGFNIGQISGARGAAFGEIYTTLTHKNDGGSAFKDLVDLPYQRDGHGKPSYPPPLDNIFPVVDLSAVTAPNICADMLSNERAV